MVSSHDNVEPFSKAMMFDPVPNVAYSPIHLLDHLPAFWGIWSIFVPGRIWFSKIQGDKVQVLLVEPFPNHLVDVQSPICLVRMIIESRFYLPHFHSLSLVGGCCAREMQRPCFETLEQNVNIS